MYCISVSCRLQLSVIPGDGQGLGPPLEVCWKATDYVSPHPHPNCHLGNLFRQISKETFLGLLYSLLQGKRFVSTPRCTDTSPLQDPLSPSWHKPLASAPALTPQAAALRPQGPANLWCKFCFISAHCAPHESYIQLNLFHPRVCLGLTE